MRRVKQPRETETSFTCVYAHSSDGWCPILRVAARYMRVSEALVKDLLVAPGWKQLFVNRGRGECTLGALIVGRSAVRELRQ